MSAAGQGGAAPTSLVPVILCGGSGARLWPLSRAGFPKQFLSLTGAESLFQQTVRRLRAIADEDVRMLSSLVVCNEAHRFLASEQLRECGDEQAQLLLEPIGRNTAPALTLAALAALAAGDDAVLAATPADQQVNDEAAFAAAMGEAVRAARDNAIVILGVKPDSPETGFGYIKAAPAEAGAATLLVERFVEKPDAARAQALVQSGDHFWNAGIFVVKASVWLQALLRFRPDIEAACREAWRQGRVDGRFVRPQGELFAACAAESVDYAVLEHCPGSEWPLRMAPLAAGWSDLGSWRAVHRALPQDADGNAVVGDVLLQDARNTLAHASSRLLAVVGVSDVVVVETADAVLVAASDRSQQVKEIVDRLDEGRREEKELHRKVHRPWGWYDSIDAGPRFKVKRIMVRPQTGLSLQKHHHRAEHWIVVRGVAEITCGDKTVLLAENQSTYIPLGATHRLFNPGKIPLEIIEVQSGAYLGEDDIVRFSDAYGRCDDDAH